MQPGEFPFRKKPFARQLKEWEASRDLEQHAALWQQRTGKSKLMFDTAAWLYMQGKIDCLLVVAPNGVHRDWILEQMPEHLPEPLKAKTLGFFFQSQRKGTVWHKKAVRDALRHDGLLIFTMSYDAVMTKEGRDALWAIQQSRRCIFTLDESKNIKAPRAKVAIRLIAAGKYSKYKRILDGTPMDKPFDIYNQMRFLKDDFWEPFELGGMALFKAYFGVWKQQKLKSGAEFPMLVQYQNLEQLAEIIKPWTSRVMRSDLFDSPPKLYMKRSFELEPEQVKHYTEIRDEYQTWYGQEVECKPCIGELCPKCGGKGSAEQGVIYAQLAIVRKMRLHQIACGYLPTDNEEEPVHLIQMKGGNPRLALLRDLITESEGKTIIWARFRKDIDMITEMLREMKRQPVRYDGSTNEDQRAANKLEFQQGAATDFVSNPQVGSEGLMLAKANTMIFYSQGYSTLLRKQAEDRNEGIHLKGVATCFDLYATLDGKKTEDHDIVETMRKKDASTSLVLGDVERPWL